MSDLAAIWSRLQGAGIVSGEQPPADATVHPPWFVRAMMGAAAWFAASFFLPWLVLLVGATTLRGGGYVFLGLVLCGAAVAMFRAVAVREGAKPQVFLQQLALVVSLSGQASFAFGLFEWAPHGRTIVWLLLLVLAVFETVLTLLVADALHRILASGAAGAALAWALLDLHLPGIASAVVAAGFTLAWLNETTQPARAEPVRAVGYGLTLAFCAVSAWEATLGGMVRELAGTTAQALAGRTQGAQWAGHALLGAILLYAAWRIAARYPGLAVATRTRLMLLGLAAIVMGWFAPGLAAALLVLILGFANGNRLVLGLGCLGAAASLGWYYYNLELTLLAKSGVLVISGLVALAAGAWLRRTGKERGHA